MSALLRRSATAGRNWTRRGCAGWPTGASIPQALEHGLIDRVGTLPDAIEAAKTRAGLKRARVVIFDRPLGWRPTYYAALPADSGAAGIAALGRAVRGLFTSSPVFLYLWTTGS
jgi:hypothetical protein